MIYIEYESFRTKYYKALKDYEDILCEKEELFNVTQPKATSYDKEVVSGGVPNNTFDTYIDKLQDKRIDERLEAARSILEDRSKLLKLKEEELRHSKDWLDMIYTYYYIDKLSVRKIEKRLPFSKSEICRKLGIIRKNCNLGQNRTKSML